MKIRYNDERAFIKKPKITDYNLGKTGPECLLDVTFGQVEVTMTASEWQEVIQALGPFLLKHIHGYDVEEDPFPPKAKLTEEEEEAIARGKRRNPDGGGLLP